MVYTKEQKEYAKKLFLTPNQFGGHKFGWTDISREIQKEFNLEKAPDPSTILKWSQEEDKEKPEETNTWEKFWKSALIMGATLPERESPSRDDIGPEEQTYFRIEAFERLLGSVSQDLILKSYKFFESDEWKPEDAKEAKVAFDMGIKIYETQHRLIEGEKLNINHSGKIENYSERFNQIMDQSLIDLEDEDTTPKE